MRFTSFSPRRSNSTTTSHAPLPRPTIHALTLVRIFVYSFILLDFSGINPATRVSAQQPKPIENRPPVVTLTATAKPTGATFDGERALAHVRKMVEIGPRPPGSKELEKTRRYIVDELKSYGLRVSTDEFDARTPAGESIKMANVAAELAGETKDVIIVASHYDTKLFKDFRFVGANDGGSSSGALLELARVLARAPQRPRFTYWFVFFDGEEAFCRHWDECSKPGAPDNTYGSRRFVAQLEARGEVRRVRAMILLDLIGYKKLEFGRDSTSTVWLVDKIWQTARELGHGAQFVERAEGIGGDDHAPFLRAGIAAIDIIQLGSYPHWHTPEDTLDKISAQSLQTVGDVMLASLPRIEQHLSKQQVSK